MSTYKVIQDIEAEDKILGPLTLRQFIYALISVFLLYIGFISLTRGAAFLLIFLLPPAIFTGFFAFPFGRDQPTEIWALAKIRFLFKPRRRIWDQSGVKELVTINVPKRIERELTNGLSEHEVRSRLSALANTIDSRGWAIKNVNVNLYAQPDPFITSSSDRLIDINSLPREVPSFDVQASDDILDANNNPIAQQFEHMISSSEQSHRQSLIDTMNSPVSPSVAAAPALPSTPASKPDDFWFLNQTPAPVNLPADQAMFDNSTVVQPGSTDDLVQAAKETPEEAELAARLKARQPYEVYNTHMRTLQPLGSTPPPVQTLSVPVAPTVTAPPDPAILSLANNNDLNVATLAREASKAKHNDQPPDDEVVISLR